MAEFDGAPLRLFFAAVPDESARAGSAAAAAVVPLAAGGRLVPRNNHHVTLAFIGEVPAVQLSVVQEIGASQRGASFALRFDAYEYWPKPEVIVAAARSVPQELQHLWRDLHRALGARGWALDPKRLRPHVTLARNVPQAPVLPSMPLFEWRVREFSLMCSQGGGKAPAYTVVDTWPLLDDGAHA